MKIADGAGLNVMDEHYWTPLHHAVAGGHLDIVKLLVVLNLRKLRHGAEINPTRVIEPHERYDTVDEERIEIRSPLHIAARCGRIEVLKLLVC